MVKTIKALKKYNIKDDQLEEKNLNNTYRNTFFYIVIMIKTDTKL